MVASIALVAVLALTASGCNAGNAWIARVNGTVIDSPNFWAGVPLYTSVAGQGGMPGADDAATFPMSDAAQYAMFLVQLHAIEQLNARNGSSVSPATISQTRDALVGGANAQYFADLPDWFIDQIVEFQANSDALVAHYGAGVDVDAAVADFYEKNKDQFAALCLDVIGGEDESELVQARQRIDEGADFATVAKAVAAAQPPGPDGQPLEAYGDDMDGDVGCVPTASLAQLFADPAQTALLTDAADGSLVGPVPVAGGAFMLFRVRSAETQSLEEARPQIEQQIGTPGSNEAADAVRAFMMSEKIELNPRLGEWVPGTGYNPPRGAEQPPADGDVPPGLVDALG